MESCVEYYREDELRAKYTNLYYIKNTFYFLTTNNTIILEKVRTLLEEEFVPTIMLFENIDKLNSYIHSLKLSSIKGVTAYFSHYYDWNIAHGLFDSLYPVYLTYLKFFTNDTDLFNLFIDLRYIEGWRFTSGATREWVLDIFKRFSGGLVILDNYQNTRIKENFIFETLITGNALAGITAFNKNGEMPGRELHALEKFRNRMFRVYNIQPKPPIQDKKLVIRVINCRRYSKNERGVLMKIIEQLKNKGHDAEYIQWENIGVFKDQLEIMNRTDIHISGCGTSMLNFPFLNDKCVHINLGANPIVELDMPGLMEVNISLLSNSITCDYYNIFEFKEVLYVPLINQINVHINNICNNVIVERIIPSHVVAWRKYCAEKDVDDFIKRVNGIIKPGLMKYRWPECLDLIRSLSL